MSDIGVYAAKFKVNKCTLEDFDNSLSFLRSKKSFSRSSELIPKINKLLNVLGPISEGIKGKLSASMEISEHSIIEIIKERHPADWQLYKDDLLNLKSKLLQNDIVLTARDFSILEDIADALDSECADLFRRMSER